MTLQGTEDELELLTRTLQQLMDATEPDAIREHVRKVADIFNIDINNKKYLEQDDGLQNMSGGNLSE